MKTQQNLTQTSIELSSVFPGIDEIELVEPLYDFSGKQITIQKALKITSKIRSKIKCSRILVTSADVTFNNIEIEGSLVLRFANNVELDNVRITNGGSDSGAAFVITYSRDVKVNNTEVTDTKTIGIFIEFNSKVNFRNLIVHDLEETLVNISCSYAVFEDCTFYNSHENGMHVVLRSVLRVSNCTFHGITYPAIFVIDSRAVIVQSHIYDVEQNGISILHADKTIVAYNHIHSIKSSSISLTNQSNVEIFNNNIHDIAGNSIYVSEASEATIISNTFNNVDFPSVAILNNSEGRIEQNTITNIKRSGVCIRNAQSVTMKDNILSDINECGISISDTNDCVIISNLISNCKVAGAESFNNSKCEFEKNKFCNCGQSAFLAYAGGIINGHNNQVEHLKEAFVQMKWKGGGNFFDNNIIDCPKQFSCENNSLYFFKNNVIDCVKCDDVTNDKDKVEEGMKYEELVNDYDTTKCLKCKVNPRNYFFQSCGHRVYCGKCAKELLESKGMCPLCRFNVENITEGYPVSEDESCLICSEKKADSIVMPCGHMGFCHECLSTWFTSNTTCPYCRSGNSYFKKIFVDF
ncbi:F-box only protein 11 isoform X2 [Histomonas meleagridis]|uniref:F-box only protein 11 isoform X2 n=1 Tax=Histomonas meleagridis TaxID=135588 RepID=UPI0035596798|nr:F-box only protein 11 isoform X2 [Histomonas meleagridis]KAH0800106.1 F-box only protein 11 isoform X2 [Histomonas meleagridis]